MSTATHREELDHPEHVGPEGEHGDGDKHHRAQHHPLPQQRQVLRPPAHVLSISHVNSSRSGRPSPRREQGAYSRHVMESRHVPVAPSVRRKGQAEAD